MEQKLLKRKHKFLKEGNKTQLAAVCNELGDLYFSENKYVQAIEEYSTEAKIHKAMGKNLSYGRTNRVIGESYFSLNDFEKALIYQKVHLAVAREEKNKLEEQRALATIGRTHLTRAIENADNVDAEALNKAYKAFTKSLMICESLKNIDKLEHMDMRARLLLNIGVVQENQGKYETGIEYMNQSIKICKSHDIWRQLQQGYTTLGLLYSKKGEYSKAISCFNLSLEEAKRLDDKIPLMVATLISKAEVYFKLADFQNAKQVLLRAHKLKSPNKEEREIIAHNLKIVAALCYTEESLLTIADSDFKLKKKLYEKMGDGACALKIYDKAIDYYKKMLKYAELNGDYGKNLIPVYISLAETYKDNKQYEEAIEYFQMEYDVECVNPKESYSTLLNIAEVYELSKKSFEEIVTMYEKARVEAQATGIMKLVAKVICKYAQMLKKYGKFSDAASLEKELLLMDYNSSDSEDETPSESGTPNIGDDINISDISCNSDNSDEEVNYTRKTRTRTTGLKIKRNDKGETPLHTACIAGNHQLVKKLLDQGHAVNIRDNAGWLPIHEACICGHKEIVQLLVQKGANLNDRGGTACNGVTPLHDACCNGHLEVIEYLLENGASVLLQNDKGETPLDVIKEWREQTNLDSIQQSFYETLVIKMTEILQKAGRSTTKIDNSKDTISAWSYSNSQAKRTPKKIEKRNSMEEKSNKNAQSPKHSRIKSMSSEDVLNVSKKSPNLHKTKSFSSSRNSLDRHSSSESLNTSRKSPRGSPRGKPIGTLRHMIDDGSSDDERPTCSKFLSKETLKQRGSEVSSSLDILENASSDNSDFEHSARSEYKRVMLSLRHRVPDTITNDKKDQSKRSAILQPEEVGDDWLEDDIGIGQPAKKRKFGSIIKQNFIETSGSRNKISPTKTRISAGSNTSEPQTHDENECEIVEDYSINDLSNDSFSSTSSFRKRKTQTSLIDSGFSRKRSTPERTFNSIPVNKSRSQFRQRQQKISNFTVPSDILEPDSTTVSPEVSFVSATPSFPNTISPTTISNTSVQVFPVSRPMLAISVRIESKLWRVPVPANDVSELTIGWLANEAARRYYSKEGIMPTLQLETKDGAILVDEDPLNIVFISPTQAEEVQSIVVSWNLPPLHERYIEICRNRKEDVDHNLCQRLEQTHGTSNLNLSNLQFKKQQLISLFRALHHQKTLQTIDLSGANLQNEGVQLLSTTLPSLDQLKSLNLSLNSITTDGVQFLSQAFTDNTKPILENLHELNLSYNNLGNSALKHLSDILNQTKLRKLNLSACDFSDDVSKLNFHLNLTCLESLDLSYNELNKSSICKFISYLDFKIIKSLNLSHNFVTENGILRDICVYLQSCDRSYINYLNLARCKIIDAEIWDLWLLPSNHYIEELNLSYNQDLTSLSLRRLIQHKKPPQTLCLIGCSNLFQYLNDFNTIWSFEKSYLETSLKSLKISINFEDQKQETDLLTSIWKQEWKSRAKIEKIVNTILHLSLND